MQRTRCYYFYDTATPCNKRDRVSAAAGVPIWIDAEARIAHAKTMAIVEAVTLTGSYNCTPGAAANSENLNLVSSPAIGRLIQRAGCQAPALWRAARCAGGCRLGFVDDSPLERRGFELLVPLVKRDGVFQDHPDRPPGPFLLRENQLTRSREGTSPNPEGSATVQMALSTSRAINRRDYRGCR